MVFALRAKPKGKDIFLFISLVVILMTDSTVPKSKVDEAPDVQNAKRIQIMNNMLRIGLEEKKGPAKLSKVGKKN